MVVSITKNNWKIIVPLMVLIDIKMFEGSTRKWNGLTYEHENNGMCKEYEVSY